jgi:hypothetical protein
MAVDPASTLALSSIAQPSTINTTNGSGANESDHWPPSELFYRHGTGMTVVYCIAYLSVFALGLVGNCFVVAVVSRSPRMRTVTNFFIVNLAIADILVIVFCLPATLMSNIFVRKYSLLKKNSHLMGPYYMHGNIR